MTAYGGHSVWEGHSLSFSVLSHLQGIVNLDAEITDGAFQFGVAHQQLNDP